MVRNTARVIKNTHKTEDKHPDLRIFIDFEDGRKAVGGLWKQQDKNGNTMYKGTFDFEEQNFEVDFD